MLDQLHAVRTVLMGQMAAMVEASDGRGAAYIAGRLTSVLETIARISGELGDLARSTTFNITNNVAVLTEHPAFLKMQAAIRRWSFKTAFFSPASGNDTQSWAIILGSILTPNGEAPMQDQTPLLCNPRDFVLDLLNFVAEQIELAKANPADQLAAIDAASGVIPVLKSRLDDYLKTSFVLALENKFDGGTWRKEWDELAAMKSPEEFRSAADALLGTIKILRTDVVAHFP